jgi:hypothetical protein
MKMKGETIDKKNKAVLSIADNPKFQKKRFVLCDKGETDADFVTYTINRDVFGLASGDVVIAKRTFKPGDIKHNTIVVVDTGNGHTLTCNVRNSDDIYAIVTGFQRNL